MQVSQVFSHINPDTRSVVPDVSIATSRLVGIELELENAANVQPTAFWNCINDHSLRNSGRELVLYNPVGGRDLRNALHELGGILYHNQQLEATERTSLHVHVDIRDLTIQQISNILVTYIATESALYKMGGKSRYDNIYCPGVTAALEQIQLMRKITSLSADQFTDAVYSWCKYTGINLRPIEQFGSIEFRAHEGTTDVTRIRNWVNVLLTMVQYAISQPDHSAILADVEEGPMPLLSKVYGRYADLLAQDGEYLNYYKNNYTNLVDLFQTDTFNATRKQGSTQPVEASGDVGRDAVIQRLREAVLAAQGG